MCFYRRSEVSSSILSQADKHHWGTEGTASSETNNTGSDPNDSDDDDSVNDEKSEKAQLRQREVFLSRQCETLPATLIRGKCSVTLLSEVENAQSYLGRDDAFFYALVYDPHAKTLVADRGEIRIGPNYQVMSYKVRILNHMPAVLIICIFCHSRPKFQLLLEKMKRTVVVTAKKTKMGSSFQTLKNDFGSQKAKII